MKICSMAAVWRGRSPNAAARLIQQESDEWIRTHGPVTHAHPAWTSGGLLPARFIIHAVGPVWGDGDEDKKLSDAVTGSLRVADELKCESISMPAISTGIFGFPKERAAGIIFKSVKNYFGTNGNSGIGLVRLVLFDDAPSKSSVMFGTRSFHNSSFIIHPFQ
jgi:O-acetyl-ADP-ribose deacetylase